MIQPILFLGLLFLLGFFAKNSSLMVATGFLLLLVIVQVTGTKWFQTIEASGINWGVTIITVAVLAPIATGRIGFQELWQTFLSLESWVALIAGAGVALIAKNGLSLLASEPEITTALVLGTILAVGFFQGVAVGPLIGAGIAYFLIQWVDQLKSFLS
ncbi:DUF441 domain-containing protein [Bacillus fonticola]|uniref:DUF441 domain-containing protein n=1 Tax=Bacillus fonticola TaxID=2728853 RepID=UPI001472F33B|nr:DUF441 domain-containing protein [Bacillus fonticola]